MLFRRLALELMLVALPVFAEAVPETPAGKTLQGWLTLLEENDEAAMRAHHAEMLIDEFRAQLGADQYVAVNRQLAGMVVGKEFHSFTQNSPTRLIGLIDSGSGWFEIVLEVEEAEPHRMMGLRVRPGAPPKTEETPPFPTQGSLEEMVRYVRKEGNFPAVAAAHWKDGEITASVVLGNGKVGDEAMLEKGARFHVGSVTKSMTATMIGRLVDQGKLNWSMTLGEQLKDIPMKPVYKPVTLLQLVRHRGGIIAATNFGPAELAKWANLEGDGTSDRTEFAKHALQLEPASEPGTEMIYSNAGYALAALIAERITGESWETLMQRELFDALKLKSAGFGWPEETRGHLPGGAQFTVMEHAAYNLGDFLDPSGDTHMAIDDFVRYAAAHCQALNGKGGYLKPETAKMLHTAPEGGDYAAGWILMPVGDETFHWHNGSVGTYYALAGFFPESNEAVAFLFNAAPRAEEFARQIGLALHERE